MKKIAIFTLNGNWNYGNRLQNYALEAIIKKIGYDVNTIWIINKNYCIKERIKSFLFSKKYLRYKKFVNFSKEELNIKYYNNLDPVGFEYDYFIVGSDQVWNPIFGLENNMKFLSFVKNKTKISFSASFGVEKIPVSLKNNYKIGINNLNYISVREEAGKRLIETLTKRKDTEVLIDPTMLLGKEEWKKISQKPKNMIEGKYILNYFLGNLNEENKKEIEIFAEKYNYNIINILNKKDPFYASGPSEFLYLEEHAELICTDSFHSCVFAILFNTTFVVFERDDNNLSMNSRIETLLSKFELNNRRYNKKLNIDILECNYDKSLKILESERKKALDFLKKALDNKE